MSLPTVVRRLKTWMATFMLATIGVAPAAGQSSDFGIFIGPPVPADSQAYMVRVHATTSSAPITVENITIGVNGQVVDVTFYLNHGSDTNALASYSGTVAGVPLAAGTYTFRLFVRERFFGTGDYLGTGIPWYTLTVTVTPAENVGEAVEYYYAALNHYFMTALPIEIAALDAGVFPGWNRTGQSFKVYLADASSAGAQVPTTPVCRFYGMPSAGLNTHFFSGSPAECAAVAATWPNAWLLETSNAFYVFLPQPQSVYPPDPGACPFGTQPLYRLFNNRADINHRYTTSLDIRAQMIAQGWLPEGYGANGVAMCAP